MSVRYGVSLLLDPAFTAGLHRARQVICSQFGCWAAEMHSVHVPLTAYFPCPDEKVPALAAALESSALESAVPDAPESQSPAHPEPVEGAAVLRQPVSAEASEGSIYLPFIPAHPGPGEGRSDDLGSIQTLQTFQTIQTLQGRVADALARVDIPVSQAQAPALPLRFALLQYGSLPDPVFGSAVRFAAGVVDGLRLPDHATADGLALFRYQSQAADADGGSAAEIDASWQKGGWAPDLSWAILSVFSF